MAAVRQTERRIKTANNIQGACQSHGKGLAGSRMYVAPQISSSQGRPCLMGTNLDAPRTCFCPFHMLKAKFWGWGQGSCVGLRKNESCPKQKPKNLSLLSNRFLPPHIVFPLACCASFIINSYKCCSLFQYYFVHLIC